MPVNCVVLDIFYPLTEIVAILDFSQNVRPHVGMILANDSGDGWEITKYGRPILIGEEIKYKSTYGSEAIWDCTLRPIDHLEILKINDRLVVK